ncbi:hypothetical protein MHZ36_12635 [Staphylococcus sp. ACRSN]|uniref:hypothetical protein n=1 Tax=Staphylococcus sp. ACRSN TaxID=2918214 RepID=UPI001EF2A821|nr:hypothetical protein [Staphylococcus sp. ACRSN]MCG7340135.1 hypothetical protein [Staphylococcus sp. ACRSN]
MSELRIEIQKLLDSEMTGYKINKATGLSQTIISGLRNGKRDIDNLTLKNAEVLAAFSKTHLN